jgi:hypothetical protein
MTEIFAMGKQVKAKDIFLINFIYVSIHMSIFCEKGVLSLMLFSVQHAACCCVNLNSREYI